MSKLKQLTKLGSNSKQLAALLQAKAPKGHTLAYINPREAAILKAHGGSGHPHADTGIPSFEDGFDATSTESFLGTGQTAEAPVPSDVAPPTTMGQFDSFTAPTQLDYSAPSAASFGVQPLGTPTSQLTGGVGAGIQAAPSAIETPAINIPTSPAYSLTSGYTPATEDATTATPKDDKFLGMSKDTLARLGLAGGLGLLGQRQAAKAADVGQKGAQQMQQLAAPYQKTGADLQAAAQRGELTPAGQQSIQAMQAQQAQAVANRGGVGAAQAAQNVEAFRQQLLQQQYDYGLKLSGIGDNIALGAIKTGMQADQYVNQLTNQFYTNMAYVASGMSPGLRIGGGT